MITMNYPVEILTIASYFSVFHFLDGKVIKQESSSTGHFSWPKYRNAADIAAFVRTLAKNNNNVKLLKLGKTYEGRPLQALEFTRKYFNAKRKRRHSKTVNGDDPMNTKVRASERSREDTVKRNSKAKDLRQNLRSRKTEFKNKKKPVIIIEAGAHAREWISPAVATSIALTLTYVPFAGDPLKYVTWVVVPLLNPDGYEYSHTTDRYWRKNRRPNKGSPSCPGVDINRNFKFEWGTNGSSTDPCSDVYHGEKAFSERETKAIRKLLKKYKNVKLYLSLHSYGQVILYPWGYTNDKPPNADKLKNMAKALSNHIKTFFTRNYRVQQAGSDYQAGGGSSDYAYSRKIPYSYYLELPGKTDEGLSGFIIPPPKVGQISLEIWNGLTCLIGDIIPEAKLSKCHYSSTGNISLASSMSRRWFED